MTSRPATEKDIKAFYGSVPGAMIARIVETRKGKVVFGLLRHPGYMIAFYDSELDERTHKKLIIQCFRELLALMKMRTVPIYAVVCEKTKDSFLHHFNFHQITDELYQWQG